MRIARVVAITIAVTFVGAATGCSSSSTDSSPKSPGASTTQPVPATAAPAPVVKTPAFTGQAGPVACATDLDLVATAVELYLAMNGTVAVTEAGLVEAQLLREESQLHDIDATGAVVPSPTSGCSA